MIVRGLALFALLTAGCGERALSGSEEPLRVRGAVFKRGELPGEPPDPDADPTGAAITVIDSSNNAITVGQVDKDLGGRATTDAVAVALAFDRLGSGYWLLPVGPPDPANGGEYTWAVSAQFAWDLPVGPADLRLVAIDGDGVAGRQSALELCVAPAIDDNLAACDSGLAPPHTVIALSWDRDVDLDIQLRTPSGKLVDSDHPTSVDSDGDPLTTADIRAQHVGILSRDSNAGCQIDGINREEVVWQTSPEPGLYQVYANLADACDQASVRFSATVYQVGDDATSLVEVARQDGLLPGLSANGGAGIGLFLMELPLE